MKILSESLPQRCEICHQRDCFDPQTSYCSRCKEVNTFLNQNHRGILSLPPFLQDLLRSQPPNPLEILFGKGFQVQPKHTFRAFIFSVCLLAVVFYFHIFCFLAIFPQGQRFITFKGGPFAGMGGGWLYYYRTSGGEGLGMRTLFDGPISIKGLTAVSDPQIEVKVARYISEQNVIEYERLHSPQFPKVIEKYVARNTSSQLDPYSIYYTYNGQDLFIVDCQCLAHAKAFETQWLENPTRFDFFQE